VQLSLSQKEKEKVEEVVFSIGLGNAIRGFSSIPLHSEWEKKEYLKV